MSWQKISSTLLSVIVSMFNQSDHGHLQVKQSKHKFQEHRTLAVFRAPKDFLDYISKKQRQTNNKTTTKAKTMSEELDPLGLNIDLENTDTSNPSLSVGEHPMMIVKSEIKPWAKDPSKRSLVISMKTVDATLDTNGNDLAPGIYMFYRLALQQQEGAFDFRKDLARLTEAAFGERRNLTNEVRQELTGKVVLAVVKPSKDTTYGETEVKGVKQYAQG